MSMSAIIGSALSGLQASQIGLRTVSNNVANVNTPGYVRTEVQLAAQSSGGQGFGVKVTGIARIADQFLQAASLRASSEAGGASVIAASLDRMQAQFGGLDDPGSLFARLNSAFDTIGLAAADSAEQVARLSVASDLQSFFDESVRLSAEVRTLRNEADRNIQSGVERINEILDELQKLNTQVQQLNVSQTDTSGAANRQSVLMDELSQLIDIRVDQQTDGRLFVRTEDGVPLLTNSALVLKYQPAGTGAYGVDFGRITAELAAGGTTVDLTSRIQSGELRGLMTLRDKELPAIGAALAEFASGAADVLNGAHNNASSVPAPNTLEGRNTGLLGTDILSGSGLARLAVVDADGGLVRQVEVEVTGAGFVVNGIAAASIGALVTELNTAFAGDATASFTNGRLSLTAADPSHGAASVQDEADPSSIGGRGFAHFFGLNDLIVSQRPGFFDTALTGASAHGLLAGGEMSFKVIAPDGRQIAAPAIAVTGTSVQDQLNALNDPATGLGQFGTFALNASGQLGFTPAAGFERHEVTLTGDTTRRGDTGLSLSQIFGLGDAARLNRAEAFSVNPEVRANTQRLSLARLDLAAGSTPGDLVLAQGDGRGGQALFSALNQTRSFDKAGGLTGGQTTLQQYASRLAGDVGTRAARAERAQASAAAVQEAADVKRRDVEGVNMDEELARMTLFQQAFNASARLLQTSREMTDILLNMV